MIYWRRLLCWPCIIFGAGLSLMSFASYAQTAGDVPISAAYWRDLTVGVVGVLLLLIGWYMNRLDASVRATSTALMQNYLTKAETRDLVEDVIAPLQSDIRNLTLILDRRAPPRER